LLRAAIQHGENVLLVGSRGIGKTDLVSQTARDLGMGISVSHPGTENPTNAQGFPWLSPDADHASFKPYGVLWDVLQSEQPHVWFWDDLGQAIPAVQAGYMQWAQGGRVGEHRLPKQVRIVAATNDRQHGANATMLEPLKDRFTILSVEAQWEDWIAWASKNGVHEDVMGYIAFQPDALSTEEKKPHIENSPTPRC
jgi:MoxR-like ATPase